MRIDEKLEDDVRRQQSDCNDLIFENLSGIMKQRIAMIHYLGEQPKIGRFSNDALDYEISRCTLAESLGRLGKDYLTKFRTLSLQSQQAVLMGEIDKELIDDIIPLAEAFASDLENDVERPECSEVLKVWSCIFDFPPEDFEKLRSRFFNHLKK